MLLDLAAWAALRTIPVLAADPPGSAGAIALIWINGFVLPPLFAGGNRRASRLCLGFRRRGLGDVSIYPEVGDVFTVRYLSRHPQDFMIRNHDQSPWARTRLGTWEADALRQASAVSGDAGLGREAARVMSIERDAGCG